MKHKVTCWDRKEGETVLSQICESKKDAQDLIDCENDLAAANGESQTFGITSLTGASIVIGGKLSRLKRI